MECAGTGPRSHLRGSVRRGHASETKKWRACLPDWIANNLSADHRRLDALLSQAVADPERFDHEAFAAFRAGLLRHIALEEKILIPALRKSGGAVADSARRLRHEHGAIALLLVPTPDVALVREIRSILEPHNREEEGPGGLYELSATLPEPEREGLRARLEHYPEVAVAPYHDGPRASRTAAEALRISGLQKAVREAREDAASAPGESHGRAAREANE